MGVIGLVSEVHTALGMGVEVTRLGIGPRWATFRWPPCSGNFHHNLGSGFDTGQNVLRASTRVATGQKFRLQCA
jgi:hypothetical protein